VFKSSRQPIKIASVESAGGDPTYSDPAAVPDGEGHQDCSPVEQLPWLHYPSIE
jgi:hypothetical protein